jgi:geranylgeranyl diphosphate synthase type I
MLPALELEMQRVVELARGEAQEEFYRMLAYHMGWTGEGAGSGATGKRIRPLLLLLSCAAAGSNWRRALPAGAAVELLHNFSLIHDDIEDNSDMRRSRPTVWKIWGIPQAINAGDAMFTLAQTVLLRLVETTSLETAIEAALIFQRTSLELTRGQYLDISYESRTDLTLEDYWPMVSGKTAALIAACTELGAVSAGCSAHSRSAYKDFGFNLGLAFQASDDLLGIWGDSTNTGKSTASDLLSGKKSLPVLYGLGLNGEFARRWRGGPITVSEVEGIARQLESEGARDYTLEAAACLTDKALHALSQANPTGEAGDELTRLAHQLLNRKV